MFETFGKICWLCYCFNALTSIANPGLEGFETTDFISTHQLDRFLKKALD